MNLRTQPLLGPQLPRSPSAKKLHSANLFVAATAALWLAFASVTSAEPIWLQCQATGPAGSIAFRFSFDEATQQATALWGAGGGRPSAPVFGETGTDQSLQGSTSITPSGILAPFRTTVREGDPHAYLVQIDRNTSVMGIRRYPEGRDSLLSVGTCQRTESPRAF